MKKIKQNLTFNRGSKNEYAFDKSKKNKIISKISSDIKKELVENDKKDKASLELAETFSTDPLDA